MLLRVLADVLVFLHFAFICFAALGALLLLRWPRLIWLHLPAMVWAATVVIMGWICPLTPWEQALRRGAGNAGYDGSFIEHYILHIIYPPGLTREVQIILGVGLLLLNATLYTWLFLRQRRKRAR